MEFGFWILDFGFWILDFGFWILDFGFWILDLGFWILDFGFWILDFGVWILDFGFWISLVFVLFVAAPNGAVWILDFGFWSLDFGFWILVWMRPYSTSFGSCIRYFHVTPTRVGGYIYIYISLRIMGSQNSWFGDPRTLLYRVQPLHRRVCL